MRKQRRLVRMDYDSMRADPAALWLAYGVLVVPGHGIPCPRCKRPTQIREHAAITKKQLNQPYYYRRWFRCLHRDCPTKSIMVDEFKVYTATKANPPSRPRKSRPRNRRGKAVLWTENGIVPADESTPPWKVEQ